MRLRRCVCLGLGLSLGLCPRGGRLLLFGGFLLGSSHFCHSLLRFLRLRLPFGELGCCTLRLLLLQHRDGTIMEMMGVNAGQINRNTNGGKRKMRC